MSNKKTAFITGITGQDGSYLAEFLLKKNYQVHGLTRRTSTSNYDRIKNIINDINLIPGDLLDQHSLSHAIKEVQPDEVYNLGAQSFVPASWSQPVLTGEFTALGVTRILEALRIAKPDAKFYQASSSEMFGKVKKTPQNENTPFYPRSPYGVAKVYGHWITVNYRESFDMFAVSGILFNHESERRGLEFVTRKIANAVARIKLGKQEKLKLGNLQSKRDWGYAPDYVEAMWLMLQQDKPENFVVGTGKTWSVEDCARIAFEVAELNWKDYVETDKKLIRPAEVDLLVADASKAKKVLDWQPKTSFKQMIEIMVKAEFKREEKL